MFCQYCGSELPENAQFCPNCGAPAKITPPNNNTANRSNSSSGPQRRSFSDSVGDAIDNAGEEIGSGIDQAASEFFDDLNNAGDRFADGAEKAAQRASDFASKATDTAKNWRDYVTPENMEILAVVGLFFPLFMGIVTGIATRVLTGIFRYTRLWAILRFVPILLKLVFVVAAIAALASAAYIVFTDDRKKTTWGYIAVGGSALALISTIGIAFGWPVVPFLFGLVALILGIDEFSKVVLRKQGIETEPDFQADASEYSRAYNNYKEMHPSSANAEAERIATDPEASYFDGTGGTLFGLTLLLVLVSAITCGIATPWMLCKYIKWEKEHTVINGRRLSFNGTGGSLIGHWIIWSLLTVVTCGIFSFFQYVEVKKWEMKHTFYVDGGLVNGSASNSFFDGSSIEYFGYGLLQTLLLCISCGLAYPWTLTMIQKWETKHEIVNGDRLYYDGTALGILGQYIVVALLSMVTLGIYAPWGIVRINKYVYKYTHTDRPILIGTNQENQY